ncbi:MAG: DUF4124 domain-containing protein [Chromatiales bacterium]|nr:DUF4124 domain-containing protein [Chromatiales bacterium]
MSRLLVAVALAAALNPAALARTYKYLDEQGRTVYSQVPPAHGTAPAEVVAPPPPPAVDPDEARARLDAMRQRLDDAAEDRELAKQKADDERRQAELEANNCRIARSNLANLNALGARRVRDADGSYRRLTEPERIERIAKAEAEVANYCK